MSLAQGPILSRARLRMQKSLLSKTSVDDVALCKNDLAMEADAAFKRRWPSSSAFSIVAFFFMALTVDAVEVVVLLTLSILPPTLSEDVVVVVVVVVASPAKRGPIFCDQKSINIKAANSDCRRTSSSLVSTSLMLMSTGGDDDGGLLWFRRNGLSSALTAAAGFEAAEVPVLLLYEVKTLPAKDIIEFFAPFTRDFAPSYK